MENIAPNIQAFCLGQGRIIDMHSLKTLSGNDDQFISQLLQLFMHKAPETVAAVENAFDNKDYEALRYNVHSFKSTVSIFGNARLSELVGQIERMAVDRAQWNLIEEEMQQLREVSEALMKEVTQDLREVQAA